MPIETKFLLLKVVLLIWILTPASRAEKDPNLSKADFVRKEEINDKFSFIVSLMVTFHWRHHRSTFLCTGSLVTNRAVLTSAHCLCDKGKLAKPKFVQVYFKSLTAASGIHMKATAVEPVYPTVCKDEINHRKTVGKDLAVVILQTPIDNVRPVPLACRKPKIGECITIFSYGPGYKLTVATSTLVPNCFAHLVGDMNSACSLLTMTRGEKGDSGGPALVYEQNMFKLIAVFSSVWKPPSIETSGFTIKMRHEENYANILPHCQDLGRML